MSEPSTPEPDAAFVLDSDENRQAFLTKHYQYMCSRIVTRKFYPHLISQEVLDYSDKEEIENGNLTSLDKACALLDKIVNRGEHAFNAFMTVLEYDCKYIYTHVTDRKPRRAPADWRPRNKSIHMGFVSMIVDSFKEFISTDDEDRFKEIESKLYTRTSNNKELKELEDKLYDTEMRLEKSETDNSELRKQVEERCKKIREQDHKIFQHSQELRLSRQKSIRITPEPEPRGGRQAHSLLERGMKCHSGDDADRGEYVYSEKAINEAQIQLLNERTSSLKEEMKQKDEQFENELKERDSEIEMLQERILDMETLDTEHREEKKKMEQSIDRQNEAYEHLQSRCQLLEEDSSEVAAKYRQLQEQFDWLQFQAATSPSPRPRVRPITLQQPKTRANNNKADSKQ